MGKSTDRVRRFRDRARKEGWVKVEVMVPASKVEDVKAYAASLGDPVAPTPEGQGYLFPLD